MKVAANLSFMFIEAGGLLQRYEAAAASGFKYVEVGLPYSENLESLVKTKERLNLNQILINAPVGMKADGEQFGLASLPKKKSKFRDSIVTAIDYAQALKCSRIHVMAGTTSDDASQSERETTYEENLSFAADKMAEVGITCLIEPINQVSVPRYFLSSYDKALEYIQKLKRPNLKLQLDVFHMQQICGSLTTTLRRCLPFAGHIQVAQVPDRHEPDSSGEIQYSYVFDLLRSQGYQNFIGCEYSEATNANGGLGWVKKYGLSFG